jgi:hypothetical protein
MFNQIDQINLLNGLNLNPIPLEFSQGITTTEWLLSIQSKVNEIIIIRNEVVQDANNFTLQKYEEVKKLIDDLQSLLNNGNIIPNGSIGMEKLKSDFFDKIEDVVVNMVHNLAKTVWFGINDNGYFYAVIPSDWEQIKFSTNQDGNLILQY